MTSRLIMILCLIFMFSIPVAAQQNEAQRPTLKQQFIGAMVEAAIKAFENPQAKEALSQFSDVIKDEYTYQFIIQKIDKFILTNELEKYEEQVEALKEALTKMRELYIESEKKAVESYLKLKQEHEQQKKQQELKESNVIEV